MKDRLYNIAKSLFFYFLILFILILISFKISRSQIIERHSTNKIEFEYKNGLPYILCHLNDKPAYFLIDTGASVTVFNLSLKKHYNVESVVNIGVIVSATGHRQLIKLIELTKLEINSKNYILNTGLDLNSVFNAVNKKTDTLYAGIIGTDFLKKHNALINYKNKIIYLENPF